MPPASDRGHTRAVFAIVIVGETVLGIAAVGWIAWRDLPVRFTGAMTDVAFGLACAGLLAAGNLGLLHYGPNVRPLRAMRRLYRTLLGPLFGGLGVGQIVSVSVAVGVAEEAFFRGAVQAEWGLATASVLFGLVHIGRADMVPLGLWAAVAGFLLGWLAQFTHGLLAPITAHATYDALALLYIGRMAAAGGPLDVEEFG